MVEMKKARLLAGWCGLRSTYSPRFRRSQRSSKRALHLGPLLGRGARFARFPIRPPRLEIARTAPLKEIAKPKIPMAGVWETIPESRNRTPRTISRKPITTRERLGVLPLKAEIRRGSSAARASSISAKRRFSCSERGISPH